MPNDNQNLTASFPTNPSPQGIPASDTNANAAGEPGTTPLQDTSILNPPVTQTAGDGGSQNPPSGNLPNSVVTSAYVPKKYGGKKVIATIFSILLIVASIGAGVYVVQRQELTSTQAWDCSTYVFDVSRDGVVGIKNGSTRNEPGQKADVSINGSKVTTLDVPALTPGTAATLGNVTVPSSQGFSWNVKGSLDCQNSGSFNPVATPTQTPAPSATPTPNLTATPAPSLTPTPKPSATVTLAPTANPTAQPTLSPGVSAKCNEVKAYSLSGNLLSQSQLSQLKAGDKVDFAVSGQASSGSFSKARFTVNGSSLGETTTKNSQGEFYVEYTVPSATTTFTVKGEVYHSSLGWI
jgi:hypothetical protein